MRNALFIILFLLVTGLFFYVKNHNAPHRVAHVERAFYYWKNNAYDLKDAEKAQLQNLQIKKLYVKFFEVAKDPLLGSKPVAKSQLRIQAYLKFSQVEKNADLDIVLKNLEIVPTVFVKNDVLYHLSKPGLDSLAGNILFLCNKFYLEKYKDRISSFKEIQIDCDWTSKTKKNYFHLLRSIKKLSQKKLSCTLRLYPYKYPKIMGVPPVDKAMLMCYNLTNALEDKDKNSIQNSAELALYLRNAKRYPLHLDIALPVFSWLLVYQNGQFVSSLKPDQFDLRAVARQIKPLWYEMEQDTVVGNMYLRIGDKIKMEEATEEDVKKSIFLLKKHIDFGDTTTISLFHLDKKNVIKYKNETLNSFFTYFME